MRRGRTGRVSRARLAVLGVPEVALLFSPFLCLSLSLSLILPFDPHGRALSLSRVTGMYIISSIVLPRTDLRVVSLPRLHA